MGNFEKLSVLVIVVIIVMILVVALYTWTDGSDAGASASPASSVATVDFLSEPPPVVKPEPVVPKPAAPATPPLVVDVKPEPPVAPPAPVEPPKPAIREHVVVSGDTLEKISKQYFQSTSKIAAIEKANPGLDPMRLRVGQKLLIPDLKADPNAKPTAQLGDVVAKVDGPSGSRTLSPGAVYTVKRGDNLPEIARRTYGKIDRWHEIWLANYERIDDPDKLTAGTRLNLPK